VAERAQPLQRTAPAWRTEVQCSGRRWFTDGVLAHVRTPGGPTSPAQSLLRLTRSSPTPRLRPSLTQSNRRGTNPYARWWGRGGIARCPPIPIIRGNVTLSNHQTNLRKSQLTCSGQPSGRSARSRRERLRQRTRARHSQRGRSRTIRASARGSLRSNVAAA